MTTPLDKSEGVRPEGRRALDFYETPPCFIYVLRDPATNEIRYVGKTTEPERRPFGHIQDATNPKRGRMDHRTCWIRSVVKRCQKPTLEIIESCKVSDWQDREQFWISYFSKSGCRLTNSNGGGVGPVIVSDAIRLKMSANLVARNRKRKGSKWSEEQRQRHSILLKSKFGSLPLEERRNRVEGMLKKRKPRWNTGWHHTPESKAKIGLRNSQIAKEKRENTI